MRKALSPAEVASSLSLLDGWRLVGEGAGQQIEKTFSFQDYYETIAFVNAIAFIAHRRDHHPDLSVHYNRCVVRFSTHDVKGLSDNDFQCAAEVDALLA
ncbi:MAG TPA: 4a-hydroxytetrahydrobiopterin dehydratase [Ramlibacter sp.]|uniref:4a-hydroxytetrahydrobiopterin dehydratase n=1 Tax=Ramlibacter sp. TaxID=1917967 RepID=UPI002BCC9CDA|nr:4a-hydroxytetrahydrobiopterin dehydratase [Ramlibacter sp.]HVZ46288.1 4a-hydroxytetrahydrobiopterin dehydratase [Ramlibacter sp.]